MLSNGRCLPETKARGIDKRSQVLAYPLRDVQPGADIAYRRYLAGRNLTLRTLRQPALAADHRADRPTFRTRPPRSQAPERSG